MQHMRARGGPPRIRASLKHTAKQRYDEHEEGLRYKKVASRRDTTILIHITKYCGICSAEQRKIANKGFAPFYYICLFWPKKINNNQIYNCFKNT
jgi:hypothetical protein